MSYHFTCRVCGLPGEAAKYDDTRDNRHDNCIKLLADMIRALESPKSAEAGTAGHDVSAVLSIDRLYVPRAEWAAVIHALKDRELVLLAEVRAWRALAKTAFAGRWCDECRSGCDGDSEEIAHYSNCPRKAAEAAGRATDALGILGGPERSDTAESPSAPEPQP